MAKKHAWMPRETPLRTKLFKSGNTGSKAYDANIACKCCSLTKVPSFKVYKAKRHHGANLLLVLESRFGVLWKCFHFFSRKPRQNFSCRHYKRTLV